MGTAMQLSEEKRQNRNAIIAAFEKHGIDYQLFNDDLQANIKTPKGLVCVFLTTNKYYVTGANGAIKFKNAEHLIKILAGGFGLQSTNQNNAGKCPYCGGYISVIDAINSIANNGLIFTHQCRRCGELYQVQASIKLTTTASK